MRLENYLNEEILITESAFFQKLLKKIGNKSTGTIKKLFRNNWINLMTKIEKQGVENDVLQIINKYLKTNFHSLDQISKSFIKEEKVNEDFKHYWELVKMEGFPSLAFFPLLQVWFEVDKLIKGAGDASIKTMVAYGLIWVFLVSGKHIKGWFDWKKKNPGEHEKEGSRKNPFAI